MEYYLLHVCWGRSSRSWLVWFPLSGGSKESMGLGTSETPTRVHVWAFAFQAQQEKGGLFTSISF